MANIGFRIFIENEKNEVKPWDECSIEDVEKFKEHAAQRLGSVMSDYFTHHPQEYVRI